MPTLGPPGARISLQMTGVRWLHERRNRMGDSR